MNTIKLILAESGQICDLKKDFPLYVGSYQNKLLNVLVPTSIIAPKFIQYFKTGDTKGTYTTVKVGMRYLKRDGNYQKTSDYYMNYLKNIVVNNVEYAVFERKLPKDFTLFEGQGQNAPKLIVNVVNILVENDLNSAKTLEIITSQAAALDVMYSSQLNNEPEYNPTDMELLSAKVNTLIEEMPKKSDLSSSMLKYNVAAVPENIVYNKDGYKTIGVLFTDEQFLIKTTLVGEEELVTGSIMATCFSGTTQTEIFNYKTGIAIREITFNEFLETTNVGEWFINVGRKQRLEDALKFLYIDEFGNVSLKQLIIPEEIDIIDSLDSERANASLSARQGKILKQFIDNIFNSLNNYYVKDETYNKEEINERISQLPKFGFEVVSALPTENISETTVYLLSSTKPSEQNIYEEYFYKNGKWELIGSQVIDLSNYATIDKLNNAISNALTLYYTKQEIDSLFESVNTNISNLQENKISRVTDTAPRYRFYGIGYNTTNDKIFEGYPGTTNKQWLAMYNSGGTLTVKTPTSANHATNKEYVDGLFNNIQIPDTTEFVKKEDGKGLSSNDFTNEDKEKLNSLENYDDSGIKNTLSNLNNSKIEKLGAGTTTRISTTLADGTEQAVDFSETSANSAVKRQSNGCLYTESPVSNTDAANKEYVDNLVGNTGSGNYLPLTGGTMTGALNIEGITNKEKAISIESPDSDAMISLKRTDVGNSISVGIGGNGTARGIWDETLQKWLLMHDGSALKLNGSATRPKYNSNDLALYSDVTNLGRFVNVASTSGTRYYPLVRFNKAISDGNNYSAVFLNGRIGGWGSSAVAYINAVFWGRDARGGEYNSLGNIKGALERADFVMYEESSTSVVLYIKINGYALARFSFSGSGEGVTNLYDGSYITSTPTGTLLASMTNGKISEKKDAELLYDMSSSSSSINWGKTSGIKAGEKVSGKDFSTYSFLRVTCNSYDTKMTYYVDLKKQVLNVEATGYPYVGSTQGQHMGNLLEQCTSMSGVNTAKTEFYYMTAGYINGSTWNERKNSSSYFVTKIEGVI